jgi:multidrug efflux pump subunit AcrB
MWIVRLALRRPYTFVAAAILIAILGGIAVLRMPTDILPDINIPVVSAIWQYRGLSADEMERCITTQSERSFTTTVNDIEHIESQSLTGLGVVKVFFHPGTPVDAAVAQMTAISQTVTRQMPPGATPPLILRFNASSVPILQLGLGGQGFSEQALYDFGSNFIRTQLATVQGASVLQPAGGRARQIMVDLDPKALYARGISPSDVSAAINAQSPILPAGAAKMGEREYNVRLNSSPDAVEALNDAPLSTLHLTRLIKEAGIPDGVVSVVAGYGETAGVALAKPPGFARMGFTGSPEVGRLVAGNSRINAHNVFVHGVPCGGIKLSGMGGGVLGADTLFDYLRQQSVVRPL